MSFRKTLWIITRCWGTIGTIIKDIKNGDCCLVNEFPIILNRYGKKETGYFNCISSVKEGNEVTGMHTVDVTATP
jgi:hypothetical protein